jgi:hypothetical protein
MADEPADVREYEVVLNGVPTTMQLNEEDAKRYGVGSDGEDDSEDDSDKATKARTVPNKARNSATK